MFQDKVKRMNLFESSIADSRREVKKYLGVIRRVRHKDLYVGRVREEWGRVNELKEAIREMGRGGREEGERVEGGERGGGWEERWVKMMMINLNSSN